MPELKQLTPHLWVLPSRSMLYNAGIFIAGGQACLIDPGLYPDEFAALEQAIRDQDALLSSLILTHGHWDHALGPECFPGVRTIAQRLYGQLPPQVMAIGLKQLAEWEKQAGIVRAHPFTPPQPDETFDQSCSLQVGTEILRLVHAPGHAPDQLVVYHPGTATLWASDILSDIEIPSIIDRFDSYERTIAMLSTWDIRALVPGHGHATTDPAEIRSRLDSERAYLDEIRSHVERALHEGKTVQETVAACAGMSYRQPEENALTHQVNIESVYRVGRTGRPKKIWMEQGMGVGNISTKLGPNFDHSQLA